jgi:hypothetical protein
MLTCYWLVACRLSACPSCPLLLTSYLLLNMEGTVSRNKSRSYYIPYNLFLESTHS